MRDLYDVLEKLIAFAKNNDNIRALVLQGSFVNDHAPMDNLSDLDPMFYVKDLSEFLEDTSWKNEFGTPMSFFHDEGVFHEDKWYTRLTIYQDGFKIDFGFQSISLAKYAQEMPLYKIYVDKDGIIPKPLVTDERNFYVKKPTEEAFIERVNTFFFDSSYVVKALARDEMFFEKYMEQVLKKKIHQLLEWYIGVKHDFHVNTGTVGRYFKKYLTDCEWDMLLKTYPDANKENCIKALIHSYDFVHYLGTYIADALQYKYPLEHEKNMRDYCVKNFRKYFHMDIS